MAKMTKAQARKRLQEASIKISNVHHAAMTGQLGAVDTRMLNKLFPMMIELRKFADKLK
jgi:hypothetical protein